MLSLIFGRRRPNSQGVWRRLLVPRALATHAVRTPPLNVIRTMREVSESEEWRHVHSQWEAGRSELCAKLRAGPLWNSMTDDERVFVSSPLREITEQQHKDATWLVEGAVPLMWALHVIPELPPYDEQAAPELLEGLSEVGQESLPPLRAKTEISHARDLAELWHWRSRTRQLEASGQDVALPAGLTLSGIVELAATAAAERGDIPAVVRGDFPAFGRPYREASSDEFSQLTSIAMERHRALNWLSGMAPGQRWDKTPTDT